tara:strand:- start:76 stop:384 length:309 start_codon:yes stop_codon:yes gene_type:complete
MDDETMKFLVKLIFDGCDGDKDELDDIWETIRLERGLDNGTITYDGIARDNGHEISKIKVNGRENLSYEEAKVIYIEKLKELHKNGNLSQAFPTPGFSQYSS